MIQIVRGYALSLDFTIDKYRDLCQAAINSQYILFLLTVRAYMTMRNPPQKCIVLRHDIDRRPENALRMAELEHELGIQSTYYFRFPYTFKPDIIRKIHDFFSDTGWTKLELGEQDEGFYGRYFVKDKKYFRTSMYQTTLYGEGPRREH